MLKKDKIKKSKKTKNKFNNFFKLSIFKITPEIKQIVASSIMFLITIIIILSFFGRAGIAGQGFQRIIKYLIGSSIIFIPLFFILLALIASKSLLKKHLLALILGMLFIIKGFSGIFYALQNEKIIGGIIGSFIFENLEQIFDTWVAWLVALTLILIGVLIIYKELKIDKKVCLLFKKIFKFRLFFIQFFKRFFSFFLFKQKIEETSVTEQNKRDSLADKNLPPLQLKLYDSFSEIIEEKKESISLSTKKEQADSPADYFDLNLFEDDAQKPEPQDINKNLNVIKETLKNFSIPVEMRDANIGTTVTQYTLKPSQGIKLSKIVSLSNDLALALASLAVIIEAPIPGKNLIGIQIPNKTRALVRMKPLLKSLFSNKKFFSPLTIVLGRDVIGDILFLDLEKMPHLLVAGMTGSGKTVCLNSIILSLLIKTSPDKLRMILMDFKRVELTAYQDIPHLIGEVICNVHQANKALDWLIKEMEDRFHLLQKMQVKNIVSYNTKALKQELHFLPYIVLAIDELADLIMIKGKEVEIKIVRLCQMGRAAGIHIILSTQRPSVEVITGLIKANIAARIALTVTSHIDSRTILDLSGAERLLGDGDMLYITPQLLKAKRAQGVYVSEQEIKKVTAFLRNAAIYKLKEEDYLTDSLIKILEEEEGGKITGVYGSAPKDILYSEAVTLVLRSKKASASLLQRHLRIGYARAARLIDILEQEGIIGPGEGAKPRKVFGIEEDERE